MLLSEQIHKIYNKTLSGIFYSAYSQCGSSTSALQHNTEPNEAIKKDIANVQMPIYLEQTLIYVLVLVPHIDIFIPLCHLHRPAMKPWNVPESGAFHFLLMYQQNLWSEPRKMYFILTSLMIFIEFILCHAGWRGLHSHTHTCAAQSRALSDSRRHLNYIKKGK